MGRFAELTYEELALPSSFKASFTFERKNLSKKRRRVCFTLQARRSRTKISVDSGVAFAVTLLMLTFLLGQATAYVLPKGVLSSRTLIKRNSLPSMSTAAPILSDVPSKLSYPEVAFGTVGVKTSSIDPDVAAARRNLERASRYLGSSAWAEIDAAVNFAVEAHYGQRRKSGEAYVVHPIETACILAEMKVDTDTIVAGLLHDVVEDTEFSATQLCARFGEHVGEIVDGVTDVDSGVVVAGMTKEERDAFNQQRLLLAIGANMNVLLVKLADRVHNMRTLGAMPAEKRAKKAKETMELFVPLAKTVGIAPVEAELRRLSAQHLSPLAEISKESQDNAQRLLSSRRVTSMMRSLVDQKFVEVTCPALLSEFLLADEALRASDIKNKLKSHREAWAAHCTAADAPHLSSSAPLRWLSGIGFNNIKPEPMAAAQHLRAAYATALVAGFSNVPAAFGADAQQSIDALALLFS